ncbi:hypothetical protein NDU88_000735, partial [Pleurodeles waltl]
VEVEVAGGLCGPTGDVWLAPGFGWSSWRKKLELVQGHCVGPLEKHCIGGL